ncbi:MAG: DoxX family membrane protein [Candidatus Aminicenantales bacterium]
MEEAANIKSQQLSKYSNLQLTALVILRIFIGWHLLYEGVAKLLNPYWSSASYLMDSKWFLSGILRSIAADPTLLKIVDYLNIIALIAIGAALIAGFFTRSACVAGIALLLLYYLSHPSLIGYTYTVPSEGSYLFINKNLIEASALFVLSIFPTGRFIGIDRLIFAWKES